MFIMRDGVANRGALFDKLGGREDFFFFLGGCRCCCVLGGNRVCRSVYWARKAVRIGEEIYPLVCIDWSILCSLFGS